MNNLLTIVLMVCMVVPTVLKAQKKKDRPNIVFIISDQHKKLATGAYGDKKVITPNIDALAKTGVKFNRCYTPAPVCAPSRAALITGMYPYANGAIYHKAPIQKNGKEVRMGSGIIRETGYQESIVTLAEAFRKNGYITASPGKMHVHGELQEGVDPNHPKGNDLGFDETSLRYYTNFPGGHYQDEVGEDTYQRYRQFKKYAPFNKDGHDLNEKYEATIVKKDEDNFDMVVANKAVEFIQERSKDQKNFFLHVGFEKPHPPLTTTQKYLDMYNPEDFELPETVNDWYSKGKYPWVQDWVHNAMPKKNEANAKRVMAAYYACITEMDEMVGRVVNALKKSGLYENTVIIYTTDHGEHMFEHGLRGKHNMYEASVNVPFIISYPKIFPANTENNTLVSFVDFMPTLCELTGAEIPKTTQGKSIVNLTKKGKLEERTVYSEYRAGNYKGFPKQKDLPSRMLIRGDYKFVYTHGVIDQLYNVKEDPNERNNLVMDKQYADMARDLCFETLAEWRFQQYNEMKIKAKGKTLTWEGYDLAESFSVYYSKSDNPHTAKMVAEGIKESVYNATAKGFYWVMAKPKLTRATKRLGKTPVFVEKHVFQLPVSNAVAVGRRLSRHSR